MKLLSKKPEKDAEGTITLMPTEEEDMWHVYNLVAFGDLITSTSFRKIQKESATGSTSTSKVKVRLQISVETIEFDASTCELRVKGKNMTDSKFVRIGSYHTAELRLQTSFQIFKPCWDSVYLERVDAACDPTTSAEVAAVVMQPGLANLCLISNEMTIVRARIEVNIPRKRMGSVSRHDSSLKKFFTSIVEAIERHINFKVVKCVILASPGFLKDDFFKHLLQDAAARDLTAIIENKAKFLLCSSASGHKHALKEAMADPQVAARINTTKASLEVRALDAFYEMLNSDPDRAYYGFEHVRKANNQKAVESLLVTTELFRSSDIKTRKQYVDLVEGVKENGGAVHIFSSMHVSGEQLGKISGVAALLRFPLPEIDEDEHAGDRKTKQAAGGGGGGDSDSDDDDSGKRQTTSASQMLADMSLSTPNRPATNASLAARGTPSSATPSAHSREQKGGGKDTEKDDGEEEGGEDGEDDGGSEGGDDNGVVDGRNGHEEKRANGNGSGDYDEWDGDTGVD